MTNIADKIHDLINEFCNQSWENIDFLTEDDVRCRLFAYLDKKLQEESICWHSEVRWYGDGTLKYRSDLVCIDKQNLKGNSCQFDLPSKGYAFDKFYALIEIKLRRPNGDSNNQWLEKIEADLRKINKIQDVVLAGA